jgi:alpha-amylase
MGGFMKRFLSVALVLFMLMNLGPVPDAAAATDLSVAEQIQSGVTLHCWNWSFANIEANMAKIAAQGYNAVQVSPIQQCKQRTKDDYMSVWWALYQPARFSIDNTGNSALGTKNDFIRMCDTAHKYGIYVLVDVVANHMGDNGSNKKSPAIIDDLEYDSSCWHDISKNIGNYYNRYDITQYCMDGIPDLNTANSKVQNYVLNFLKECIDAGADGFRFDAAKHIETPDDNGGFGSNFWPTVVNGAKSYAKSTRNMDLYCYGELLYHPDEGGLLSDKAYTKYFCVTDNSWSDTVRNSVIGNQSASSFNYSYHKDASASQLVLWAESHDNYAGDGSQKMSVHNINKTWALVAARADAMSLYLARPSNFYPQKLGEATMSGWNYDEVGAVNRFHTAFAGQSEYVDNENGIAYVERGTSGVILVNCSGTSTNVQVTANQMKDGTYIDQITGNTFRVSGGKISGNIGSTGIAVVYNAQQCQHLSHNAQGLCTNCRTLVGHDYNADDRCSCGAVKPQGRTVYFRNSSGWSNVNIYSWYTQGDEITASWPGDAMTKVGDNIYSYVLPADAENVIFNNGSTQTADLLLPAPSANPNIYDYASGTWKPYLVGESDASYYLFGYINGKDYACEDDAANMGQYQFKNGKLEVCFTEDSYVAVKRENNAKWYMTDGWIGMDTTSAILYDTAITGEHSNKLYVPGGVDLIFTLQENKDGSLTLSYSTVEAFYSLSGALMGTEGEVELQLTLNGQSVLRKTVTGKSYRLNDLMPGTYVLTVSNPKCVTRSYCIQIVSEDVTLDLLLCSFGDVNGDGKINLGDTAKIYAHIRGSGILEDNYALLCADVDQNEKINLGDVARSYATVLSN